MRKLLFYPNNTQKLIFKIITYYVNYFRTDWKNHKIIYTQYFPEKSLNGDYDLEAYALGTTLQRSGKWNMTLYDYAQTTTITRIPKNTIDGNEVYDGQPVDVKVVIDRIGNMQIHVSNILNGANLLGKFVKKSFNFSYDHY